MWQAIFLFSVFFFFFAGVLFLTSFPSLSFIFGSCPSPGKDTTGRKEKAMAAGPPLWGVQVSSLFSQTSPLLLAPKV